MQTTQSPIPSLSDEALWITAAQAGDMRAMHRLLDAFTPVLERIAGKYRRVSLEDALQEARLAFLQSIHRFDPSLGVPFEAYAVVRVHGAVRTAMRRWWTYLDKWAQAKQGDAREDAVDQGFGRLAGQAEAAEAALAEVEWPSVFARAGLSPRERLAMTAVMHGVSMHDLAENFQVSLETAKTWRKRGLQKLRRALADLR